MSANVKTAFRLAVLLSIASSYSWGHEPEFTSQTVDDGVQIGYGIVIDHVDSDKRLDILMADKSEIVWYRNPGGRDAPWNRFVMARNLTARDNVCLAARDLDGDGMVEVAVGANWNPGETSDTGTSGAVFYLKRPENPQSPWQSVRLSPHDPTVHRMHWVDAGETTSLFVLPLHGRDNKGGEGTAVRLIGYQPHLDSTKIQTTDLSMHMTHNFHVVPSDDDQGESMLIAGREGIRRIDSDGSSQMLVTNPQSRGAGEIRHVAGQSAFVVIEPMHGNEVVLYRKASDGGPWERNVLDNQLRQGHALAVGDLLGTGQPQIVAGWRSPNSDGKVGVRLYDSSPDDDAHWTTHVIDDNKMACEDLRLADLDADGRIDIVAAGRSTNNLVVYWNNSVK